MISQPGRVGLVVLSPFILPARMPGSVIAVFVAIIGVILAIAGLISHTKLAARRHRLLPLQQTSPYCASSSFWQWRPKPIALYRLAHRELQMATGLGLYSSFRSLSVSCTLTRSPARSHTPAGSGRHASYLVALATGSSLCHQRSERRAFTPDGNISLCGSRQREATRISLADSPTNDRRDPGER